MTNQITSCQLTSMLPNLYHHSPQVLSPPIFRHGEPNSILNGSDEEKITCGQITVLLSFIWGIVRMGPIILRLTDLSAQGVFPKWFLCLNNILIKQRYTILWENACSNRHPQRERNEPNPWSLWAALALPVWLVFTTVPGLCVGQLCVCPFFYWLNPHL